MNNQSKVPVIAMVLAGIAVCGVAAIFIGRSIVNEKARAYIEASEQSRKAEIEKEQARQERLKQQVADELEKSWQDSSERIQQALQRDDAETVSFTDMFNFPEEYMGKHIHAGVWLRGKLRRDKEHKFFGIGVQDPNGRSSSAYLSDGEFGFVLSESFGRLMDLRLDPDALSMADIRFVTLKLGKKFIGRIYRIDLISEAGNIVDTYEDK